MVNVITEIVINCSKMQVADYAANPDHAPVWYDNIDSSDWRTPKPLQLGSQIAFRAKFLGKELAYIYEIVEFIPGEKLTMKTAQGPFPMETTYTWTAINTNTTKMTLQNKGEPKGFSKLFSPVMATMMKKANEKDLKKIKAILENQ
ncbi:SRPBCC family protein [Sutcliffiella horikoshii]|uniref:SRPBCC family protein n=1 Tax=Sutcliffiella horikoshii TaxID=79883 RepID=UPI001CBC4C8A|nr:SRPBCC family protein [Sutcliffiella horikoshii]UAL48153.1 SRPBCC family protein [Sutcliffiella horikoshii]